ncbi:receptor-like protein 7 isoform X1 [Euphorbia lathyris]|uniref:receptor-like protein 7 isoform X1 n=1 Tax=Euphorbia lathyris TaxID=212925 RepID=UPI003313A6F2
MEATFCSNLCLNSLLFLSLSVLSYHSFGLQQPLCRHDDRSSLLQFKQSFVFDKFSCDPSTHYTNLDSWKVTDDCCSWDGVDCDDQTGHVIRLDLSSSCLYGSINSSSPLFRLLHLTGLNLSNNNYDLSTIPGEIRRLTELKHLNLSFAKFSGQIPSEILKLSKLVSLDLSQNPLMLQKPSLKDVVETFTHLAELDLRNVNISSPVPESLLNLTYLSSLLLENCSLQGEFPSGIFHLRKLRVLSLRYNPDLTGYLPEFQLGSPLERLVLHATNFSGQLPISIENLRSLTYFIARGCGFVGLIPSSIGNLTKLKALDLSENYFSGNIPSSLGNLLQLIFLALSFNNFRSSTLHWLDKLTNLQILELEDTNSYGPVSSSFRNMTQLNELWLDSNQLSGEIPSWLGNSTKLTKLLLSFNELQGPIPDSIFQIPNIEAIGLYANNLSGSLRFDSFLQSKYLLNLQISKNHLSLVPNTYVNVSLPKFQILALGECNLTELPAFLRVQHELVALDLSHNNINGYVPDWIFTLKRLIVLELSYNFLKGFEQSARVTLPRSILIGLNLTSNKLEGSLPIPPLSIAIYDVSQNKFSGHVAPLFCNLTSLSALDLSDNNLSGNLPPCLGNLGSSSLVLNLRNNSLSGKIPDNFASGCALKLMDLSQNKIEGKVPRSLANCSKLEILNLEKNQMNDVFPSWLGILPNLRVLSLRSNKFHGAMGKPISKSEFGQLQIIDLSHNYFTGKLPREYFSNWVAMKGVDNDHLAYMQAVTSFVIPPGFIYNVNYKYSIRIVNKGTERAYEQILVFFMVIDLSSNRFEGEIPEIIGTLRELQSLNLSNNLLTGHIPSSLGNFKHLEALDLSLNELSGDIPTQLALLTFLVVFNVSHNSLTGLVPQGNQFNTFENDSFSANPGLCGQPLSRKCGNSKTLPLPSSEDDTESRFEINWEIVLIGFGSGLAIGVSFGCTRDTKKYERLVKKFSSWLKS